MPKGEYFSYMRGRPIEFEDLVQTSVLIQASLIKQAKENGINISEICREAIARALNLPTVKIMDKLKEKLKPVPPERMKRIGKFIRLDYKTTESWVNFLKKEFDIDITPQELIQYCRGY